MRIAIVVGEVSGDMLGAGLMRSLQVRYPNAIFEGIGGPLMEAQGCRSFIPMERLSVMGLVEILGRVWELYFVRKRLIEQWKKNLPDVFIGIDAPEFNTGLEIKLKELSIPTVHYVSPSVWAWRPKRIHKIAKAVDLMLTLFPFEVSIYEQHNIPVKFVGHHLADSIPLDVDIELARHKLELSLTDTVVCLLPGSREGEVNNLGPVFIKAAEKILKKLPSVMFLLPAINQARYDQLNEMLLNSEVSHSVKLVLNNTKMCITASDSLLMASGTVTLEGLLLKKPMVVSYIISPISAMVFRRLLQQPFISLPNLLAGRKLVPEILQEDATPENLSVAVLSQINNHSMMAVLKKEFLDIHTTLKCDANERAAEAISDLLNKVP
jgi:lipid-A-disaccharide synthase